MYRRFICFLALGVASGFVAHADDIASDDAPPIIYPAGSEPQPAPSPIRWDGSVAMLGAVRLDSATKTISVTGWVNQVAGPIEVFACGEIGKVHESVLVTPLNPLDLQAALLLVGLKSGEPMPSFGQGPPQGALVDIFVDWESEAGLQTARAEDFIWNLQENAALSEPSWTYTGSVIQDGQFRAFAEETFVATFWDPNALINVGHPAGGDDDVLGCNTNVVPPYRTPITLRVLAK